MIRTQKVGIKRNGGQLLGRPKLIPKGCRFEEDDNVNDNDKKCRTRINVGLYVSSFTR